jgi:transcriptional regulator with XRE-family HTH domain
MPLPEEQRRLLGSFVRARREAFAPTAAGLPAQRRRTPGLRREEVAQLCGISTTWYTWVEQGRDISLSTSALARLADALRLTTAERAYLFELARQHDLAPYAADTAEAVPEGLRELLLVMSVPAYLLDRRWHVCATNPAAAHLLAPWFESGEPCLLRYVFLNPSAPHFIADWEHRAQRILAEFRADIAQYPEQPENRQLIADLWRGSEIFARLWDHHAVLAREGGTRRFLHPQMGEVAYEQHTLVPAAHPAHKITVLMPQSVTQAG